MQFKNEKHKVEFTAATKHIDKEDKVLLAVITDKEKETIAEAVCQVRNKPQQWK